jgi:Mg-chelatase subunit ChlD
MIEIARPWMFALLVALPLLWLGMRRSIAAWTPPQRRICTAVRILLLALIVLALAGLRVLRPSAETSVLFVVDGSASVSPEAANSAREFVAKALASKGRGDSSGVIGFSEKATLWQPPAETAPLADWPILESRKATDIGAALDFASALFPSDQARRIILLSDGNDTTGRGWRTAFSIGDRSVDGPAAQFAEARSARRTRGNPASFEARRAV